MKNRDGYWMAFFHHLILSIAAALLSFSSAQLPGADASIRSGLIGFSFTLFIYRLSAWQPVFTSGNGLFRLLRFPPYLELLSVMGVFLFGFSAVFPGKIMFALTSGSLAILYFLRWEFSGFRFAGLRSIPLIKNLLLAFTWAFCLVYVAAENNPNELASPFLFMHRFLLLFVLSLGVDLRDIKADQQYGIKTLPVVLNYKTVKLISISLSLLAFLIELFYPLGLGKYHAGIWLLVAGCLSFLNERSSTGSYTLLLDGILLLTGVTEVFFLLHEHFR